jgi:hypothetical protein
MKPPFSPDKSYKISGTGFGSKNIQSDMVLTLFISHTCPKGMNNMGQEVQGPENRAREKIVVQK